MRVTTVLFAALAEQLGTRGESLELPEASTAGAVLDHYRRRDARLGRLGRSVILAVNQEFCPPETRLREGDEVALLPPMSGGCGGGESAAPPAPAVEIALLRAPLPPLGALPLMPGGHGAVATFEGVVRGHDQGRTVVALEYEAYESMARARMSAIAAQAGARWPLLYCAILHRLGRVEVGEASVRIVVASAHRAAALAACQFAIDTLKQSVPIWKKEHFAEGAAVWSPGELPTD